LIASTEIAFGASFEPMVSHISFEVNTGVRQGCVISAFLFNIAIDWVMRCTTEDQPRGTRWTLSSTLDNMDHVDDIRLLSHTHRHMQEKTSRLSTYAHQVGLSISLKKMEVMTLNTPNPTPIKVEGEDIPQLNSSPTKAASSDMVEELAVTSRADLTKLGMSSGCSTTCGGPPSSVTAPSPNYRAVFCQHSCMNQGAGEL